MLKDCFYKVGQFQICKGRLALLNHSLQVFLFKEFATDDSNASFELCRVTLVVCCFSDHGNIYAAQRDAMQHVKRQYKSL